MDFVNLYIETEYTMLHSSIKIKDLIAQAKTDGYQALAITDLNNMHGVLKFYDTCKAYKIKPIIGLQLNITSELNFYNSLLLYAKGVIGYKNLLALASIAKTKSIVSFDSLKKYSGDLIALLPSDESEIIKLVKEHNIAPAEALLKKYQSIFPSLYLGVDMQTDASRIFAEEIIHFGNNHNLKSVAINKTSYLKKEDFDAYQMLRCIDLGVNQYLYSEKEMSLYFINQNEARDLYRFYPELINNTSEIANSCNLELDFSGYKLPLYPEAQGRSFEYLSELCKLGLNKRLKGCNVDPNLYKKRLLYELDIINRMGFCDYFLIVYDFVLYAKKNKVLVGPGRGSAPGSLVAYCLGITDIDPMEYDLLFERFLNPERITMPDIDVDFPDNRRDEVIQYVMNKYGKEKVAHISTFGSFGVRLAVRDVARVMKLSNVVINEILKFVSSNDSSMGDVINENERFRDLIASNSEVRNLVNIVLKIEGLPRHISTHAAGIIMADDELVNYTALQPGINGLYQTQYEASDLEKIGLVKMDFLGIRNLTIIDEVVKKIQFVEPDFKLHKIPMDDKYTYQMIASGDTDGIFQLESAGMRNVLRGLKTSTFMDIVNANALYRPGPREMIPSFINRKFNREPIDYIDSSIKEILAPTYGTIVFQEQIMLVVQKFAGYTLGMADILRRAVSKKKSEILIKERERFIEKSLAMGHDEATSNKVYDYIVKFADYGFNKSHSVAYSLISYQMAYLKRRYYQFFMAVLMTNSIGSINLIKSYVNDCRKKNVKIYGPSINESEGDFIVKDGGIYYSLLGIQNVGALTLSNFLEERKANGRYRDYNDFIARTKNIFNKRVVEGLIHAGALDEFKIPRKQMILEYENSLNIANYSSMLGDSLLERSFSDEEYSFEEISNYEREALGFNFKYSLFSKYQNLQKQTTEIINLQIARNIKILFGIQKIRVIKTKHNEEMAFLTIFDDSDQMDSVIFPLAYRRYKDILTIGAIYVGEGNVEVRNERKQFIINNIYEVK